MEATTRRARDQEPALPFGEDPQAYAEVLRRVHEAAVLGGRGPARPREVIRQSWERMRRQRVGTERAAPHVCPEEQLVAAGREEADAALGLAPLRGLLDQQFSTHLEGSDLLGVVADRDARVLARFGSSTALARADRLDFVRGAHWTESVVGTNAIGTAALLHRPVQVHGPEHWCTAQHAWSCAAAPLTDPRTGKLLGVLDVSGPVPQAHPALLGLVASMAAQAELTIRQHHLRHLEDLRAQEGPGLSGTTRPWVLVDRWGWVAAASGCRTARHLHGAERLRPGPAVVEQLGLVEVRRAGPGYLLTPAPDPEVRVEYVLDQRAGALVVTLDGQPTAHPLGTRHREVLELLHRSQRAWTAAELAGEIWGSRTPSAATTARAELCRLRRRFPELVSASPHRLLRPLTLRG